MEQIEQKIFLIRNEKVILDADLAELYGVETGDLNRAVKRNKERFPEDFMFQLTEEESMELSHLSGENRQHGGRRYRPFVFTEQGAGMIASILRSPTVAKVAIEILRAFTRLRQIEEPQSLPSAKEIRNLFDAIRDAILLLPGDERYTTSEPCTYFLQAGNEGPIKIGSTKNMLVRLRTLYMLSPLPLKLLGVMKGADAEAICHVRLGAFCLHGEWFAPSPVVLDFIRKNAMIPESGKEESKEVSGGFHVSTDQG